MKPADMHRRISAKHGIVNCMSPRNVDELVQTINPEEQVCLTKVDRGLRQRRALKATSNIHTNALIQEDGRIIASEVAEKLNIRQLEPAIPNK